MRTLRVLEPAAVPYVPVVDLDRDPQVVAAELDEVCSQVGFFQIVGHELPAPVVEAAWVAAQAFFDLPLADRMACVPPSPGYPYGYTPMAGESLNRSLGEAAPPDLKELFNAGPVDRPTHSFTDADEASVWSPNLWPATFPDLEVAWTQYYRAMLTLSGRLMSLFARGLDLPEDYFASQIDRSPSALRAACYPARNVAPEPGQLRAGEHTDYGTLTLLRQDDVGGLQVRTAAGDWADVPSVPEAFVVNIGDLMARWTNDRWRSTLHRVVDPVASDPVASDSASTDGGVGGFGGAARRQSMPFFHNANWDARVECLPTCLAPGEEPRYPPVLAGPHLMGKFRRTVMAG